jgi:hypothetical protein
MFDTQHFLHKKTYIWYKEGKMQVFNCPRINYPDGSQRLYDYTNLRNMKNLDFTLMVDGDPIG